MTMPATINELQELLEQRNLYPWYAAANGTDPHDGYGVKKEADRWVTYRSSPMAPPEYHEFKTEQEAVADLVDRLRQDGFASQLDDLH